MRISEKLATTRPFFSFEFFPPKDEAGSRQLFTTIEALMPLRPAFVSITYGAAGSDRARTVSLAKQIQQEIGLTVMAHVTCVGSNRAELRALFDDLKTCLHFAAIRRRARPRSKQLRAALATRPN
jgi:methylenetetrahydrofolate reductase (NADPH)